MIINYLLKAGEENVLVVLLRLEFINDSLPFMFLSTFDSPVPDISSPTHPAFKKQLVYYTIYVDIK